MWVSSVILLVSWDYTIKNTSIIRQSYRTTTIDTNGLTRNPASNEVIENDSENFPIIDPI